MDARRPLLVIVLLSLVACTQSVESQPSDRPQAAGSPTPAAPSASSTPTPAPSPSQTPPRAAPDRVNPVSLPALMQKKYDGRALRLGEVTVQTDAYTQHSATFKSGALTISGIMNVPSGKGRFPVLVLAHGYIDPDIYVNGQGLRREQDWLARAGFAVLHVDYRGHASSDDGRDTEERLRLGYTEDVINAVHAIRKSRLPFLDKQRVGLLGRSMGGGVAYNVLVSAPGLVDAAVVYAPVSSNAVDNFNRWIRGDSERSDLATRIIRRHGSPERRPGFWRGVSARGYFGRITEPMLIQHGTADESCPIRWSRRSQAALQRAGVNSRLIVYPGEPHAFIAAWPTSMVRTVRFFNRHLRA